MPEPDRTESVSPDSPLPASIRILDPGTCLDQRFEIRRVLGAIGFSRFSVTHFDFVHPAIPGALLPVVEPLLEWLERVPFVRALSGSMLIHAER